MILVCEVVPGSIDVVAVDVTFVGKLVVAVVVVEELGNVSFDGMVVVVTLVAVVVSTNAAESVYCILYAVHKKDSLRSICNFAVNLQELGTLSRVRWCFKFTTVRYSLHKCS